MSARRRAIAAGLGLAAALCLVTGALPAQSRKPLRPRAARPPAPAPVAPGKPSGVEVVVVEVAGARAYLAPGAKSGVRRNSVVLLDGKEYRVAQATDSYAVIDLGGGTVAEKDKGRASMAEEEDDRPTELAPPRPLSTWQGAWTPQPPPADAQQPRHVPIGDAERDRRLDVTLDFASGGLVPLSGQPGAALAFAQLGARVHDEPFSAPVALDVDAAVQQWAAADLGSRVGGPTRSVVWVRELLASYRAAGWYAGFGRMKYAASTLGALDGVRAAAPAGGGVSVAAFGGFLPDPLGGELSTAAQRFGVEARFDRPDSALRPEAALVVQGSTFRGALDERRISGVFALYPGPARVGGHFEVSGFDAGNPWKASPYELTAAGLDESVRLGNFDVGARIDLVQPERSRWLASFLPASWFCRTVPAPVGSPPAGEACDGSSSTRALGSVTAGVTLGQASFTLAATGIETVPHPAGEPRVLGGFATGRVVRIANVLRVEGAASYSASTFLDMLGATVGPGVTVLRDALDVSMYYRVSDVRYASVNARLLENGVGGTAVLFPSGATSFTLQGEGMAGGDVKSLFVFGTIVWRPRL
ncbi:MAG TPA: hypothetical protein VE987_14955 [Polyangiaceae bacterium]|nr:hypothetical protein [Polyangiaceae bacterium]